MMTIYKIGSRNRSMQGRGSNGYLGLSVSFGEKAFDVPYYSDVTVVENNGLYLVRSSSTGLVGDCPGSLDRGKWSLPI